MGTRNNRPRTSRTIHHANLGSHDQSLPFSFVVCADTQLGMSSRNVEWETELAYARRAVQQINAQRPLFCVCCGDLVDMEGSIYQGQPKAGSKNDSSEIAACWTQQECIEIQNQQFRDFQEAWSHLDNDIAMICVCGNHDVGNRPTATSIARFVEAFGVDDYFAFWCRGTYNLCLNTSLFSDPCSAPDLHQLQLEWLEKQLEYATANHATSIFVLGHHPWFLYREDEEDDEMNGVSKLPEEWNQPDSTQQGTADSYFHIPTQYRKPVMDLFRKYRVDAAFAGHFHQNLVSKASFGMDMIITGPLSCVIESSGKPPSHEPSGRGIRIVQVHPPAKDAPVGSRGTFSHHFELLSE
jgi:3',5'-cyclic AMP phosphodiesterase CpdA